MLQDSWKKLLGQYEREILSRPIENDYNPEKLFFPHVVYGGAHRFSETTITKLERIAVTIWQQYSQNNPEFAQEILPKEILPANNSALETWYQSVSNQLTQKSIFDYRIDFEDGFGYKPKDIYLAEATRIGKLLAEMPAIQTRLGIRILSFQPERVELSVEILSTFLETFYQFSQGKLLPKNFVITLPKIKELAEIQLLTNLLDEAEETYNQRFEVELMLETPEVLSAELNTWLRTTDSRCSALHLGVYDLLSALGIPSDYQATNHEICHQVLLKALSVSSGKNVRVSTGAALQLAIPPHSDPQNDIQQHENKQFITNSWRKLADYHLDSLRMGVFQGWDLHPNQIPIRIAVYHAFFQKHFSGMMLRLQNFELQGKEATRNGQQFDDQASVQGLLNTLEIGRLCGAIKN
ncbi:MAG: hypothetical protein LC115_05620 [Bacteroidia bacterium]|nr:hypothetical protein [Bacteroidia bacterium]